MYFYGENGWFSPIGMIRYIHFKWDAETFWGICRYFGFDDIEDADLSWTNLPDSTRVPISQVILTREGKLKDIVNLGDGYVGSVTCSKPKPNIPSL